jgi:hypothetical protein
MIVACRTVAVGLSRDLVARTIEMLLMREAGTAAACGHRRERYHHHPQGKSASPSRWGPSAAEVLRVVRSLRSSSGRHDARCCLALCSARARPRRTSGSSLNASSAIAPVEHLRPRKSRRDSVGAVTACLEPGPLPIREHSRPYDLRKPSNFLANLAAPSAGANTASLQKYDHL